ncbi:MAG: hypothetical protein PSN44_09005 [Gammaproteobacteria bacterium]|nr:hypothetical protein [Gammaproteobacteria bacterium]
MNESAKKENFQWDPKSSYEQRKSERRSGHDQREMIRFELNKSDRRSGEDRRSSAISWGSDDPV